MTKDKRSFSSVENLLLAVFPNCLEGIAPLTIDQQEYFCDWFLSQKSTLPYRERTALGLRYGLSLDNDEQYPHHLSEISKIFKLDISRLSRVIDRAVAKMRDPQMMAKICDILYNIDVDGEQVLKNIKSVGAENDSWVAFFKAIRQDVTIADLPKKKKRYLRILRAMPVRDRLLIYSRYGIGKCPTEEEVQKEIRTAFLKIKERDENLVKSELR